MMAEQPITVRSARSDDAASIISLLNRQLVRQQQASPVPLHKRQSQEVTELVNLQCLQYAPLVAVNAHDAVRGYVLPDLWVLSDRSLLRAFLTARNGIASTLTLPDPQDEDASDVAWALLSTLTSYWRKLDTTGDLIRWPSGDTWLEPTLKAHGFLIDSICAFHPPILPVLEQKTGSSSYEIRHALPRDEEAVMALFQEELVFQAELGLFVRVSADILEAFHRKLVRSFSNGVSQEDTPRVLVAETPMGVIGMAECNVIQVSASDEPGFTPPGVYGCVDNVCVSENSRGQGVGRALALATMQLMGSEMRDGYLLWYSVDNALAARSWSRLGFTPQWTTYQRLYQESGPTVKR